MNAPARTPPTHATQTLFAVQNSELLVGGQPLSRLAARIGQTPFYAYDRAVLARRVAELRAALPAEVELHYAMKANPMPALVGQMARLVDGIDVASAGELQVALDRLAAGAHTIASEELGDIGVFAAFGQSLGEDLLGLLRVFAGVGEDAELVVDEGVGAALGDFLNAGGLFFKNHAFSIREVIDGPCFTGGGAFSGDDAAGRLQVVD